MSLRQSFMMAFKNIMASKVRSLLTMLGIIIGVAAVIIITGLGNGMETYMEDSFKSMGTNLLTVQIIGRGSTRNASVEDMYQLVRDNPEYLDALSPTVTYRGGVKVGTESLSSSVTGVSEDYFYMKNYEIAQGRDLSYIDMENRSKVCIVGNYISKEFYTTALSARKSKSAATPSLLSVLWPKSLIRQKARQTMPYSSLIPQRQD